MPGRGRRRPARGDAAGRVLARVAHLAGTLAENELSNRIGAPFQYWNAVGTVAAIAIPLALWLGSRRTGSVWWRALAYPAVGLCVLAILLTQSRGALRPRP